MGVSRQCNTLSPAITAATAESALQVKVVGAEEGRMKWALAAKSFCKSEHLRIFVTVILFFFRQHGFFSKEELLFVFFK